MRLDARLTLARHDLAADNLEGIAPAERYAPVAAMQTTSSVAAIRRGPDEAAERVDELLFGELFDVIERGETFAWGQARRDGYVGYVEMAAISPRVLVATHSICARSTFAFATPAVRAAAAGPFSLNALVTVTANDGTFAFAEGVGWISARHLAPIGRAASDPATVAEALVGAPYLWGGRSSLGLDCSGLVQQALFACGRGCPRDADLQQALGAEAARDDLRRGDLVFWSGHVGMMVDAERLVHANAHHMAVAIEPVEQTIGRVAAAGGGPPTAFRRL